MDPDPGGPKTSGGSGFGSATLIVIIIIIIIIINLGHQSATQVFSLRIALKGQWLEIRFFAIPSHLTSVFYPKFSTTKK